MFMANHNYSYMEMLEIYIKGTAFQTLQLMMHKAGLKNVLRYSDMKKYQMTF